MIELLIKSSGGDPYTVTVDDSDGLVSVFCTCQAGSLGQDAYLSDFLVPSSNAQV